MPDLAADAVLCVPPPADREWDPAADDLAYDPRWQYGVPPRAEPELAWVQHALAHLRPGCRAVLLLTPAVAARPAGRRIRAELLRRGALRAVIGLPAGAAPPHHLGLHLWLLRHPAAGDTADRLLLADLTGGEEQREAERRKQAAELVHAVTAFEAGAEPAPTAALSVAAVRVMDLLDDAVDLTPGRRLHGEAPLADPAELVLLRDRLGEQLDQLRALLPGVAAASGRASLPMINIAELARAGAIAVTSRGARVDDVAESVPAGKAVPVWQARDVLAGTGPTGHLPADRVPDGAVRVAEGDVVTPIIGRRLTARVATSSEAGAVLGASLTLLRPDPAMLDSWFLAGFLGRDTNSHRAGSLGSVNRFDVRRAEVPRIPVEDQRAYGELFQRLTRYDTLLAALVAGSGDLLNQVVDGCAAGILRPDDHDGGAA